MIDYDKLNRTNNLNSVFNALFDILFLTEALKSEEPFSMMINAKKLAKIFNSKNKSLIKDPLLAVKIGKMEDDNVIFFKGKHEVVRNPKRGPFHSMYVVNPELVDQIVVDIINTKKLIDLISEYLTESLDELGVNY